MSRPALVAPDSFKGSFPAVAVAAAIARGLRAAGCEAAELPVADGGEGTMDVLLAALGACHAIVGQDALEAFEERTLDLASVAEATTLEQLEAGGRRLVDA